MTYYLLYEIFFFKEPIKEVEIPRYQKETLAFNLKKHPMVPPIRHALPRLRHRHPMTNKPQQPKPVVPPPLINKDDLLGPSKPVFKSASIGDNGMLTKVDEGGCFNESSLEMMGFDGGQQWNDVPHQSTPRNSVHHGAHDLTDITFFVDHLKDETNV